MSWLISDKNNLRDLPVEERLTKCASILKNGKNQSDRWEAVWLTGEIAREVKPISSIFQKAANLLVWVLNHDNDGVVKHEVCYQIAASNMRQKISDLVNAALHNSSALARHEALECLGGMEAFDIRKIIAKALEDPVPYVKETASFAIKRLERMKQRNGQFKLSSVL